VLFVLKYLGGLRVSHWALGGALIPRAAS
jgi:hypothetical protein